MSKAYDPSARANAMVVKYKVNATGDRWVIPYNDNGTKAAQEALSKKLKRKLTQSEKGAIQRQQYRLRDATKAATRDAIKKSKGN